MRLFAKEVCRPSNISRSSLSCSTSSIGGACVYVSGNNSYSIMLAWLKSANLLLLKFKKLYVFTSYVTNKIQLKFMRWIIKLRGFN